jgi:hypothetical protein
VKKSLLLGLPLVLISPLMLLMLGMGSANIEAVRAACATTNRRRAGSFGIGTLNWRGASHYTKNPHPGERPYGERVPNMVSQDRRLWCLDHRVPGVRAAAGAGVPRCHRRGSGGSLRASARGNPTADAIAYQPGAWRVDEVRYVSIKYGGPMIQVPLVRFTSTSGPGIGLGAQHPQPRQRGRRHGRDARCRRPSRGEALQRSAGRRAEHAAVPRRRHERQARFKRLFLSLASGWSAANPSDQQIDWIMGSPGVTFSGTVVDRSTNDNAHSLHRPSVRLHHRHRTGSAGTEGPSGRAGAGRTGSGSVLGRCPTGIRARPGSGVSGKVTIANANIKWRAEQPRVRATTPPVPDFITLNEVEDSPERRSSRSCPGYGAYRDPVKTGGGNVRPVDQQRDHVAQRHLDHARRRPGEARRGRPGGLQGQERELGPLRDLGHLPAQQRRRGGLGRRGPPHDQRLSIPPPVGEPADEPRRSSTASGWTT